MSRFHLGEQWSLYCSFPPSNIFCCCFWGFHLILKEFGNNSWSFRCFQTINCCQFSYSNLIEMLFQIEFPFSTATLAPLLFVFKAHSLFLDTNTNEVFIINYVIVKNCCTNDRSAFQSG